MATANITFTGQAAWAKFQKPDPKYGHYGIDLFMDSDNLAKYEQSGAQMQVRTSAKDDQRLPANLRGQKFVTFRRRDKQLFQKSGELKVWGPPSVLDADGQTFSQLIGNGSEVTITVSVFDTQMGKGSRLEEVVVTKHVPYVKQETAPAAAPAGAKNTMPF